MQQRSADLLLHALFETAADRLLQAQFASVGGGWRLAAVRQPMGVASVENRIHALDYVREIRCDLCCESWVETDAANFGVHEMI